MRFLRGKWFVLACCVAVGLGLAFGSGWLGPLLGVMGRPLESVGLKLPPVVRLTSAEHAEQEKRLSAAFGDKRPKSYTFVQLGAYLQVRRPATCDASRFAVDGGKPLPDHCDITAIGPAHRVLLGESHPKTETVFEPRRVTVDALTNSWAAFFLGRDGKAKILVWTWGRKSPFREMSAWTGRPGERRIAMKRMDDGYVFLGDDPGPRAVETITPQGIMPALSFSGVRQHGDGNDEGIGSVYIDADVAQRFRFYAALKGKAYREEDWVPAK